MKKTITRSDAAEMQQQLLELAANLHRCADELAHAAEQMIDVPDDVIDLFCSHPELIS